MANRISDKVVKAFERFNADQEMAIRQIKDIADARVNRYRKED